MEERNSLRKKYFRMYYRKNRHRLLARAKQKNSGVAHPTTSVSRKKKFESYAESKKEEFADQQVITISFD